MRLDGALWRERGQYVGMRWFAGSDGECPMVSGTDNHLAAKGHQQGVDIESCMNIGKMACMFC
jgi:hypothetical protein